MFVENFREQGQSAKSKFYVNENLKMKDLGNRVSDFIIFCNRVYFYFLASFNERDLMKLIG